MKKFLFAGAAIAAAISAPALAGPSRHSFAWTHQGGTAVLVLNGSNSITADLRGWVDEAGFNNGGGANANYIAGICGSADACGGDDKDHNNYFVFDLAGFNGAITSAELRLFQPINPPATGPGFLSTNPSETYTLWDTDLAAAAIGGGGLGLFADLAGGISFGSVLVDSSTNGNIVSIALNAAGLVALNSFKRLNERAVFGGSLNIGAGVPEPASWAMMLAGFGLAGSAIRRRRRGVAVFA